MDNWREYENNCAVYIQWQLPPFFVPSHLRPKLCCYLMLPCHNCWKPKLTFACSVEDSRANGFERAITLALFVSWRRWGEGSADMLHGDVNLAHRCGRAESSWIKRRTRLSQLVCTPRFSCLSHKALAEQRGGKKRHGTLQWNDGMWTRFGWC